MGPLFKVCIGAAVGPIAKPPVGLRPKAFSDQCRKMEIAEAILRYVNAHKQIPNEWLLELEDLNE